MWAPQSSALAIGGGAAVSGGGAADDGTFPGLTASQGWPPRSVRHAHRGVTARRLGSPGAASPVSERAERLMALAFRTVAASITRSLRVR